MEAIGPLQSAGIGLGRERGVLKSKNIIVGQKNNVNAKMKRKKQKIDTLDALGDEIITILTTINICLRYE